jgi:hypothetical protein
MYSINKIITMAFLSVLSLMASASPVEQAASGAAQKKNPAAGVGVYKDTTCRSRINSLTLEGAGAYRCVTTNGAQSIQVHGAGCSVQAWPGARCTGGSFQVRNNECHSVQFNSYSIAC